MNDQVGPPARPGWVRWVFVGAVLLVLLALAVIFLVSGEHGPGRHM